MYAVIEVVLFSLHARLRLEPGYAGRAVALVRGEGRRARVAELSEAARAAGVCIGMGSIQALAECPGLVLWEPGEAAEREAESVLLVAAWGLSPRVELSGPGLCTVDLAGRDPAGLSAALSGLRLALEGQGLPVRIGVADTPLTARFAAHAAGPLLQVSDSRAFLEPLPVELLDLSEEERMLFSGLGLRTLGELRRLPRASFAQRLGLRGERLWDLAGGGGDRPLLVATPPQRFEAGLELEEPVETLEPLLFILKRFSERLAGELGVAGLAAESLALSLRLDDGKTHERLFRLPEPSTRAGVLFRVLENHLLTLQTDSPVVGLELQVSPARAQRRQDGLFDTALRDPQSFYDTLSRVVGVLGAEHLGTPGLLPTHRPDAVVMETPAAAVPEYQSKPAAPERGPLLRRLRPPEPATVALEEGLPVFVHCGLADGPVVARRGPYRLSGDWWNEGAWAREEWDVELGGGGLYRLLHSPEGWFLEGNYD